MEADGTEILRDRGSLDSFEWHVILEALGALQKEKGYDVSKPVFAEELKIRFEVNGVALPFLAFMKVLEEQHDDMVKRKAAEMIKDNPALEGFVGRCREVEDKLIALFEKDLGMTSDEAHRAVGRERW